MVRTLEFHVGADLEALAPLALAVEDALKGIPGADELAFQVNLCVDELATNAVMHGGTAEPGIHVTVAIGASEVEVTVSDGGRAHDPLSAPAPDLDAPLDARAPGGLGVHFVRTFMDDVAYRREGGRNVVKMRKRLSAAQG
jgi:anti-sigma regulatory factor (Ser/Thr protein kinase)